MSDFGPGHFTTASTLPFFSDSQLLQVDHFVATYKCAKNSLGYSKRVLGGILFNNIFVGSTSTPTLESDFRTSILSTLESRVQTEFGDATLEILSLEYTNQCFKQKSVWHKDFNDGHPYLNVFIPLDDLSALNGMTLLRIGEGKSDIEMSAARNHWYSFDGSITHCAGAGTGKKGTPRRALMAVFRRKESPEISPLSTANYKSVISRRLNKDKNAAKKKKRKAMKGVVASTRVGLRSQQQQEKKKRLKLSE